jgi:hypothetical protein
MRLSLLLVATLASYASAFPAYAGVARDGSVSARAMLSDPLPSSARTAQAERIRRASLSPLAAPVAVPDAAHPFMAPTEGDKRGPCPGLNTLACV